MRVIRDVILAGGMAGLLLVGALAAGVALAEVTGSNSAAVDSSSDTVTFSTFKTSLTLINDAASANELYARVFHCGDTPAAATTASPIRLEPGESVTFNFAGGPEAQGAGLSSSVGYCAFSYIAAATETATLRYLAK